MQGSNIVDDDCYELKDINGDEFSILVVLPVEQGTKFYLFGKIDVQPEFKTNGVSSGPS